MSRSERNYEAGAELTYKLVRDWTGEAPRFAFPPKEIALDADLRDIGDNLARNDGARELTALLVKRCVERTGQSPTVMMLRVVLEELGIEVEYVALGELGIQA